jgi:tungstate transport system ATP-binding protein
VFLSIRHLFKAHDGVHVLKDVSLDVERGEVFALIGSSGSGKTTLLRLAHLLDRPTSGELLFDGRDTDVPEGERIVLRRRMAMVFQRPTAFHASVFDNVAYGLKVRGMKGPAVARTVAHALETVELSELQKRNARSLSGGELQRVALARAMVTAPELLFLDEPTANLDPVTTRRVETLISRVIGELDTTVIMATHDMAQGQRLATRLGVLLNGEISQTGSPVEVFSTPRNKAIADFVGVENIFEGRVVSNEDDLIAIEIDGCVIDAYGGFAVGEAVHAFIRPEEVVLALHEMSTSARNSFHGPISHIARQGPLAHVTVDCGFPLSALVTVRSVEEMGLAEGGMVRAFFKATGVHVVRQQES